MVCARSLLGDALNRHQGARTRRPSSRPARASAFKHNRTAGPKMARCHAQGNGRGHEAGGETAPTARRRGTDPRSPGAAGRQQHVYIITSIHATARERTARWPMIEAFDSGTMSPSPIGERFTVRLATRRDPHRSSGGDRRPDDAIGSNGFPRLQWNYGTRSRCLSSFLKQGEAMRR